MKLIFWFILLIPSIAFGGNVASMDGIADSSISTIDGKAGTGIESINGITYNDGDAAGPDTWYYPAAKGEGDFGTEAGGLFPSYHFGNTIAVGSAGTATKLAAKVDANTETSVCRICLHEADYTLLAGCSVTMDGTTNPYWAECVINQAVSGSTTYVVVISCASSSVGLMKDTGSNGIGSNVDYSAGNCPDGTDYGVDAGNSYGVRIYVD